MDQEPLLRVILRMRVMRRTMLLICPVMTYLPWSTGETPTRKSILKLVRNSKYKSI